MSGDRAAVDFFSETDHTGLLETHIVEQLRNFREAEQMMDSDPSKDLYISIFLKSEMTNNFVNISTNLGLEKFRHRVGSQAREYCSMYVYEKNMES